MASPINVSVAAAAAATTAAASPSVQCGAESIRNTDTDWVDPSTAESGTTAAAAA